MKESVNTYLLGLISLLLLVQTVVMFTDDDGDDSAMAVNTSNAVNKTNAANKQLNQQSNKIEGVKMGEKFTINNDPSVNEKLNTPSVAPTLIKFANMEHDFGNMNEGDKVNTTFEFTNVGKEPLLISNAKGSCGCTVPSWPKEPILPGEKGKIEVEFDSKGKFGQKTQTVTLTANTVPPQTTLMIKAFVDGTPPNLQ